MIDPIPVGIQRTELPTTNSPDVSCGYASGDGSGRPAKWYDAQRFKPTHERQVLIVRCNGVVEVARWRTQQGRYGPSGMRWAAGGYVIPAADVRWWMEIEVLTFPVVA